MMYSGLVLALAAFSNALPAVDTSLFERSINLKARSLQITSHVAELQHRPASAQTSSRWLHEVLWNKGSWGNKSQEYGQADLLSLELGEEFATNVSFGAQQFVAIVDTGSSDTWLVESGFTCVNITDNSTLTEADCYFGSSGYTPDSTFVQIPDENFNITYGDGEYLNGIVGYDQVTFSGITVPKQEVALANLAAWEGDGVTSGLVGLAFPAITSAFAGTNASADNFTVDGTAPGDHEIYSPLINTIFFVDNLTLPQFSLALSRDESNTSYGGVIAIGGYPNPSTPTINATGNFASTPIEFLAIEEIPGQAPAYTFYTITVEALTWTSDSGVTGSNTTAYQSIVDSGTTLNYIPSESAAEFNTFFDPPATLDADFGIYFVDCNAVAPSFSVLISGETFLTNPYDLILPNGDGTCISGIQDGGEGPFILGDVFLKNVLAVFDLTPGDYQMHFSPRVYYES